jgi:Undecaprenyl-phosphate glucose phosphotransferase
MSQLAQGAEFNRDTSGAARIVGVAYHQIGLCVALVEAALIVGASVLSDVGYHYFLYQNVPDVGICFGVGIVASVIYGFLGRSWGLYSLPSLLAPQQRLSPIVLGWAMVFLVLLLVLFLLKVGTAFSRGSMIAFASLGLLSLFSFRLLASSYLRAALARGLIVGRRAVIIGDPDELAALNATSLFNQFGIKEVARVVLAKARSDGLHGPTNSESAKVGRAIEIARDVDASEIVVVLHWSSTAVLELVRDQLRGSPLPVRLLPNRNIRSIIGRREAAEAFSVELQREPLTRMERAIKRMLDISLASAIILTLFLLLLAVAVAIKLDTPGPVIFRQRRNGFSGRQFIIYKFRTMNVIEDGTVIRQAKKSDARVTTIGRLLRRSSIDELPQLFNVLKGDMSLVGPRPHAVAHDDEYGASIANYAFRHHVKPGITGWAQVSGFRGETIRIESMMERVEADLWYINNWSLWLDLRIMFATCFEVARGGAAY